MEPLSFGGRLPFSSRWGCAQDGRGGEWPLTTRPHPKSTLYILKVRHFKFDGRHIPKTGMEPLGIIHILDELTNIGGCLFKGLILFEIDLLVFQRFEKVLILCI